MTKDFAMLVAARRLEGYLSRERYNLEKMKINDNVSTGLMETKAENFNGLVLALNDLFAQLSGTNEALFEGFALYGDEEMPLTIHLPSYDQEPAAPAIVEAMGILGAAPRESVMTLDMPETEPETVAEEVEDEPKWVLQGYATEAEWLADKVLESVESPDDLSVAVDVSLSQYRADQVLTEYSETAEQDIDTYVPEDDVPVSVLPQDMLDEDEDDAPVPAPPLLDDMYGELPNDLDDDDADLPPRSTSDLRYLNHTVDNERLNNDPTQIVHVETAVEREGVSGSKGTDIDISSYSYRPESPMVADLIEDEIRKLRTPVAETAAAE